MVRSFKTGHRPDYFLATLVAILTVAGLVILSSASSDLGRIHFNDSYYYLKHQIYFGLLPGLIGLFIASRLNYQHYRKLAFPFLLVTLALLALVFTKFGLVAGGASRWLRFGSFTFQPGELLKLTLIMYLAAWLANPKANRAQNFTEGLVPFSIICGLVAALLLLQPATSMVVILIGTGLVMYFLSGAKLRHLLLVGVVGVAALAVVVAGTPYRRQRIATFFNTTQDAQGSSYQVNQAIITIGSGGLTGVGFGQSTSKVNFLPAPTDDSIFAVAAQELGFIGAGSLVVLFGLLVFRLMWIAKNVRDRFGQLMVIGFGCIIAAQSIVNMGAISGLIPLTGVPLPFISSGGTALAVFLTMMGIALNVSKYT
jgi:cell division protein FtsW